MAHVVRHGRMAMRPYRCFSFNHFRFAIVISVGVNDVMLGLLAWLLILTVVSAIFYRFARGVGRHRYAHGRKRGRMKQE